MDGAPEGQDIAAVLKARMLSGAYGPGHRVTEMELAEEFGVGRGRVREIFRTLVGQGWLEFAANRGVFVRRYSRAEMLEVGRAREAIEGLAARLAAEALPDGARASLAERQARLDAAEAAGDLDRFNDENRAYHALVAGAANNRLVTEFLERVRLPLVRLQLPRSFAADSMERSNRDHRVITSAILQGLPDAAEAAMRAHVRAGNAHIATLPESAFR